MSHSSIQAGQYRIKLLQTMDRDIDDFQSTPLVNTRPARITYLVTHSQADLTKFPTRKEFGKCIKKHFNIGSGKVRVQHGALSRENHQDGGDHYHVTLKLTGPKRWKSVKDSISLTEGITVHFSDRHDNYHSAYKYICKKDESVEHSKHHLELDNVGSPRTKLTTQAYRRSRKPISVDNPTGQTPTKKKAKRLTMFEVSDFLVKKKHSQRH